MKKQAIGSTVMLFLFLFVSIGVAYGQETVIKAQSGSMLSIYQVNENADGLEVKNVTVKEKTTNAILKELIKFEILPENVKVLKFSKEEINGKLHLNLDLSEEFQTYLGQMGSSGEVYTLGAIVNTYLKAFKAEDIRITCNGEILGTGHNIYDIPMEFFTGLS